MSHTMLTVQQRLANLETDVAAVKARLATLETSSSLVLLIQKVDDLLARVLKLESGVGSDAAGVAELKAGIAEIKVMLFQVLK